MKYSFLAVTLAVLALTACEYKKHPMDKPPPSASVERDSAPNFDDLNEPDAPADGSTGAGGAAEDGK
ncbi:hypothetical protein [Nitrosovibrio sp. Nv17]|jgi:hypothetical protein|uniref:hypothetical protein n=1 Tax=Nitrosovibrio sp. Nv17 TaxID=1855339 RepID=UPI000908843B|nr:hypothetical protein [Nitrosovibrio sp. Nv17]SFW35248.1 hypothetical protein SAMN05216414_12211 [Nitrosovibrio sp. Nv17]